MLLFDRFKKDLHGVMAKGMHGQDHWYILAGTKAALQPLISAAGIVPNPKRLLQ